MRYIVLELNWILDYLFRIFIGSLYLDLDPNWIPPLDQTHMCGPHQHPLPLMLFHFLSLHLPFTFLSIFSFHFLDVDPRRWGLESSHMWSGRGRRRGWPKVASTPEWTSVIDMRRIGPASTISFFCFSSFLKKILNFS